MKVPQLENGPATPRLMLFDSVDYSGEIKMWESVLVTVEIRYRICVHVWVLKLIICWKLKVKLRCKIDCRVYNSGDLKMIKFNMWRDV